MRVAIIGNSGSGKSTLAQHIAERHSLPALDLDRVAWEPGRLRWRAMRRAATCARSASSTTERATWVEPDLAPIRASAFGAEV